ncbi:hypothetical protein ACRAWF_18385 [Streptomyces sp. L7]
MACGMSPAPIIASTARSSRSSRAARPALSRARADQGVGDGRPLPADARSAAYRSSSSARPSSVLVVAAG